MITRAEALLRLVAALRGWGPEAEREAVVALDQAASILRQRAAAGHPGAARAASVVAALAGALHVGVEGDSVPPTSD